MKKTSNWKRGIFIADTQAPYHRNSCVALCCAYMKKYKPDLVVLGGDILDLYSISRFTKHGRKFDFVADELKVADEEVIQPLLDAAAGAEMWWIEGNHEYRLRGIIADHLKALTGFPGLSLQGALRMKERGIKYIEGEGNIRTGVKKVNERLLLMHGVRCAENTAKKIAEDYAQGCVMQGHVHKAQMYRRTTGSGNNLMGVTSPALCHRPEFGDPFCNYSLGFVTFQWRGQYQYQVQFQDINSDGTELYGNNLGSVPVTFYAKYVRRGKKGIWEVSAQ